MHIISPGGPCGQSTPCGEFPESFRRQVASYLGINEKVQYHAVVNQPRYCIRAPGSSSQPGVESLCSMTWRRSPTSYLERIVELEPRAPCMKPPLESIAGSSTKADIKASIFKHRTVHATFRTRRSDCQGDRNQLLFSQSVYRCTDGRKLGYGCTFAADIQSWFWSSFL